MLSSMLATVSLRHTLVYNSFSLIPARFIGGRRYCDPRVRKAKVRKDDCTICEGLFRDFSPVNWLVQCVTVMVGCLNWLRSMLIIALVQPVYAAPPAAQHFLFKSANNSTNGTGTNGTSNTGTAGNWVVEKLAAIEAVFQTLGQWLSEERDSFLYYAIVVVLVYISYRIARLLRSTWQEKRTVYDGKDNITFCAHCTPQLLKNSMMSQGGAYEKRFYVPAACPRCSWCWTSKGWRKARITISNSVYQNIGTYSAMRMQRERDVHCPLVNQLDVSNEYRFVHRFLQLHAGTLGDMEEKRRFWYSRHTRSYCLSTEWIEIDGGDCYRARNVCQDSNADEVTRPLWSRLFPCKWRRNSPPPDLAPPPGLEQGRRSLWSRLSCLRRSRPTVTPDLIVPPGLEEFNGRDSSGQYPLLLDDDVVVDSPPGLETPPSLSYIQRMRQLWQFLHDHDQRLPQSTMLRTSPDRIRVLFGGVRRANANPDVDDSDMRVPLIGVSRHMRLLESGIDSRVNDSAYMAPPEGTEMVAIAGPSAVACGPVTHATTVHNASDRASVTAALAGRSMVKNSVFPDADGIKQPLSFKSGSRAAVSLKRFWSKLNKECLTDDQILAGYHKHFANKTFKEIVLSKFSMEEVDAIHIQLQTVFTPEELNVRKANGKNESVLNPGKHARLTVDNTIELMAVNIVAATIFQHVLFDKEEGVFYDLSIKHRPREEVLDDFAKMMMDPFNDKKRIRQGLQPRCPKTCVWEIDQTGMELHERCDRHGVGILSYTYNALIRINQVVRRKLNAEFATLHEAKIVYDVKNGMRLRFRIKAPEVAADRWFVAKFPDMYMDSGWLLTSGVNFVNELSGVFSSITENPQHLFARSPDSDGNPNMGKFRLRDGTFDWKFTSIPLYQTEESTEVSSFDIFLKGKIEGDDGAGAASSCLADPRNGGDKGLIIRQQEDLGYSAKLKTMIVGRAEFIGAHFPVKDGVFTADVPWIPAVKRYTSKVGIQTNVAITPSSTAARFLSLASMFSGRNEPLQRAFELSALRTIDRHTKDKDFWDRRIRTDGYHEIDRAFGDGTSTVYTLREVKSYYERMANTVYPTSESQIRMLNMSVDENVDSNFVTRDDFSKLMHFADMCRNFDGDHESAHSVLPVCLR